MEDPYWIPGTWLQPVLVLAVVGILELNHKTVVLSVFYAFQNQ